MLTRDVFIIAGAGFARRPAGCAVVASACTVALLGALAGCGQKGPLVQARPLPPPSPASSAVPAR